MIDLVAIVAALLANLLAAPFLLAGALLVALVPGLADEGAIDAWGPRFGR